MTVETLVEDILEFWFGIPGYDYFDAPRDLWWEKDPRLDETIRSRYFVHHQRAVTGRLDDMAQTADGSLSLILLIDQFSRNMFRGRPESYAGDERARTLAHAALSAGFDQTVSPIRRLFFYLPFEHSETMADQDLSVSLFEKLHETMKWDQSMATVLRHREIIARFGRFPHRNLVLNRRSTPEEINFLKEDHSSF